MSASDHLGPQFIEHADLGNLQAGDFAGKIGQPGAVNRFDWYNRNEGMLSKHREAGGPKAYLAAFTEQVKQDGQVHEPITVAHFPNKTSRIWDGHHRALAAHAAGLGVPARHHTIDELTR